MTPILAAFAFLRTKAGAYLAVALAVAAALGAALLKAFAAGKASERTAELTKEASAAADQRTRENEIDGLSDADLQRRAARWVRDDAKR